MTAGNVRSVPLASGDDDLQALRQPILVGFCGVLLGATWLWIVVEATTQGVPPRVPPLLPPVVMMVAVSAALLLARLSQRGRTYLLLGGAGAGLAIGFHASGAPAWLYFQSLVASVAVLLAGPGAAAVLAVLLSAAAGLSVGLGAGGVVFADVAPALGLLWATVGVAWLSSRNLYTVLHWAMESQARAWRTTNEVIRRREELRRTLDSLRHAHAALARTTRELEAARIEAEESRQVKSRFVSNISHELRTPINIIVGFAEVLCFAPETYGEFAWPSALRDDVLTIWRNAEHLLRMVDDVLDLAQIEASRLPVSPEPTDVGQLVRDTVVTASGLLRDSGLELRVTLPAGLPRLNLDRTRIRQVVLNLINNAIRATTQGYVEVGGLTSDREVTIYVRDSGEGIPPSRLEAIFDEFEQVDTSIRRPYQGVGLGLAICRHFIRLHGGRIWAESALGQGSTLFFSLPLPARQTAVQPMNPRRSLGRTGAASRDSGCAVAVCRDPLVRRLLERHVEGLQVLAAESVEEAQALVREHHPDIALVAAESSDGVEAAMQEAGRLLLGIAPADIPVMVSSVPTERRAGAALGVEEFLLKPVTRREIVSVVRRLCDRPRRLLVVDDEADMVALLHRILTGQWPLAEVRTAASGEEGLALAQGFAPDVIVLDLLMPGMGGAEFLSRLRADPDLKRTPVVVVTARGPAESIESLRRGEIHLLRNTSFSAGELVRLLDLLAKGLPADYVRELPMPPGSPGAGSP